MENMFAEYNYLMAIENKLPPLQGV